MDKEKNLLLTGAVGFYPDGGDITLALHTAHACLGAVVYDKIVLRTNQLDPLTADGQFSVVGPSGTFKTKPHKLAYDLSVELGITIPSKTTTNGLSNYLFEVDDSGNYVHIPYGLMVINEGSSRFAEGERQSFMAGTIEMWSCIHDHFLPFEYWKNANYGIPQNPYISILINMIEDYIPRIPDYFWKQGLAGRMLWNYISLEKPKKAPSWLDFRYRTKMEEKYFTFKKELKKVKKECEAINNTKFLTVTEEADKLCIDFENNVAKKHWDMYTYMPLDYRYHYLKRLRELTGKTALRYAIGRYWMEHNSLKGISKVNDIDMQDAIKLVKNSSNDLQKIFNFKDLSEDTSPEDIRLRKRMDAVKKLLKKGYSLAVAVSRTNSYKADSPDVIKKLFSNKEVKEGKNGYTVDGVFYETKS